MRLSQYVNAHGIDPFTRDDFFFVGGKLSVDPTRLILVGGQALEVWGFYFSVKEPKGDNVALTEDTDWLGNAQDAKWLCDLLGKDNTELKIAGQDDFGPQSALAFIGTSDGRVLLMDFLHSIVGAENDEVRRLAVPIEIEGVRLSVLHPILCLKSRFANLHVLPSKRTGNGQLQAQWSVSIVEAFLKKVPVGDGGRLLTRACHQVAEIAELAHGRYCYLEYRLDPCVAVTPEIIQRVGGRFESEDWPRTLARIKTKQERWTAFRLAQAERAKSKA